MCVRMFYGFIRNFVRLVMWVPGLCGLRVLKEKRSEELLDHTARLSLGAYC